MGVRLLFLLPVLTALCTLSPLPAEAAPSTLCTIRDPRITEASGLAATADRLWTMNDGGDRLQVFELDHRCTVVRVIENKLDPYDVEDLARAADGTIWLADIGDNSLNRSTVALERIRPDGTVSLYRLTYPDGPHDAESILLTPSGQIFLATKEPLVSNVYTPSGPLSGSRPTPLKQVASLSFLPTGTPGGPVGAASQVLATGGAVSPDGRTVVIRTYTDAYVWPAPDGDVAAALKSGRRERIPLPADRQGEGIAFTADGKALLTSTEGIPGAVREIPLGAAVAAPASPSAPPQAATDDDDPGSGAEVGDLVRTLLIPVAAVVVLGAVISYLLAHRR